MGIRILIVFFSRKFATVPEKKIAICDQVMLPALRQRQNIVKAARTLFSKMNKGGRPKLPVREEVKKAVKLLQRCPNLTTPEAMLGCDATGS